VNLLTMRAKLRTRLGVPDSDGLYTDAVCTSLINSANHYLESEAAWGWLETEATVTTIAATATYALPAGYRASIGVMHPDGFPLDRGTAEQHRLFRGASGVPHVWDVFGGFLRLAPTPSGILALTHAYIGAEAELSGDSDTPTCPSVWHDAIVEYAAYLGFRRWGAATEAGSALAAYQTWLEQMLKQAPRYSESTGGGEMVKPEPAEQA
jgi:hypothetical protein